MSGRSAAATPPRTLKVGAGLWLGGVLLMAAALRFKGLNDESLWLDELYSAEFSDPRLAFTEVANLPVRDIHPPLYQLVLWLTYKVLGYTELAGRLPSAILGVACVYVLYLLGRDLLDRRAGIAAAAIGAVNLALIQYSQETRSYELFVVLAGLSWWRLHWMLERRTTRDLVLYALATILLIYTHYYSVVVVAAQIPVFACKWLFMPTVRRRIFSLAAICAVAFAAAAAPLLPYVVARREWADFATLPRPPVTEIADHVLAHFGLVPVLLMVVPILVALDALVSNRTAPREREALLMLVLWAVLGYSLPWLKSILSTPAMNPRYSLPQVLPVIVLSAHGFVILWKQYRIAMTLAAVVFLGLSANVLRSTYYWPTTKDEFRNVLVDVAAWSPASVPIYERIPFNGYDDRSNQFQAYANLLGIERTILGDRILQEHRDSSALPECFWLIDAHYYSDFNKPFDESPWSGMSGFVAVQVNSYRGAESVLMAREASAEKCAALALPQAADEAAVR